MEVLLRLAILSLFAITLSLPLHGQDVQFTYQSEPGWQLISSPISSDLFSPDYTVVSTNGRRGEGTDARNR